MRSTVVCAGLLIGLASCGQGITDAQPQGDGVGGADVPGDRFITTGTVSEVGHGTITIGEDTIRYVEFTMVVTFSNPSTEQLFIHSSHPAESFSPSTPRIERLVDGHWEAAFDPPTLMIDAFRRVEPNRTFVHEFHIRAFEPDAGVQPAWLATELEGIYRIHYRGGFILIGEDRATAALHDRTSNEFEIAGDLPWSTSARED